MEPMVAHSVMAREGDMGPTCVVPMSVESIFLGVQVWLSKQLPVAV